MQVKELSAILLDRPETASLMLRDTKLGDDSVQVLVGCLSGSHFKYLNLNSNHLSAVGVSHVMSIVENCPKLEVLA